MEIKCITTGPFMTNTYIVTNNDMSIIIDPTIGLEKYKNELKNYNIKGVLLTHGHIDHIYSLSLFNTGVYISCEDYNKLFDNNLNLANMFGYEFNLINDNIYKLNDEQVINIIGLDIQCILTPGHTSGSMCFIINDILFSGDTFFQMSIGRSDFPTGDYNLLLNSLNKIKNLNTDYKIYPGHGCETTLNDEIKYNPYFK